MKKTTKIILIIAAILMLSCSKSEDNPNTENDVAVSPPNLFGVWYNKQIINSDGSVVAYVNACAGMRDNLNLKSSYMADFHEYLGDCSEGGDLNVGYTFVFSTGGGSSYISFGSMGNYKITKLTNKTLQLEYDFVNGSGVTTRRTTVYSRE